MSVNILLVALSNLLVLHTFYLEGAKWELRNPSVGRQTSCRLSGPD